MATWSEGYRSTEEEKQERERGSITEALRHGGAGAWRPYPDADGPYTCNHTATGIELAVWWVREEGGAGQSSGVPEDSGRDDANDMARAQDGARMAGMAQDRVGEGLVTWDGQVHLGDRGGGGGWGEYQS